MQILAFLQKVLILRRSQHFLLGDGVILFYFNFQRILKLEPPNVVILIIEWASSRSWVPSFHYYYCCPTSGLIISCLVNYSSCQFPKSPSPNPVLHLHCSAIVTKRWCKESPKNVATEAAIYYYSSVNIRQFIAPPPCNLFFLPPTPILPTANAPQKLFELPCCACFFQSMD